MADLPEESSPSQIEKEIETSSSEPSLTRRSDRLAGIEATSVEEIENLAPDKTKKKNNNPTPMATFASSSSSSSDGGLKIPIFNGSGWKSWKAIARLQMDCLDYLEIVEGVVAAPADAALLADWKKRAKRAHLLLAVSLTEVPQDITRDLASAGEVWAALLQRYDIVKPEELERQETALVDIKLQDGGDGEDYIRRVEKQILVLKDMGVIKTEASIKNKFIAGLPQTGNWRNFRSGLYSTQATKDLKALGDEIIEEAKRCMADLSSAAKVPYGASAVSFSPGKAPPGPCHQCGNTGHWVRECKMKEWLASKQQNNNNGNNDAGGKPKGKGKSKGKGKQGNAAETGPPPPPQNQSLVPKLFSNSAPTSAYYTEVGASSTTLEARDAEVHVFSSLPLSPVPHSWLVDSGAEAHMTGNITLFSSPPTALSSPLVVRTAGGDKLQCNASGTVIIQVVRDISLTLHDVLFVPGLYDNLVSTILLEDMGAKIVTVNKVMTITCNSFSMQLPRHNTSSYRIFHLMSKRQWDEGRRLSEMSVSKAGFTVKTPHDISFPMPEFNYEIDGDYDSDEFALDVCSPSVSSLDWSNLSKGQKRRWTRRENKRRDAQKVNLDRELDPDRKEMYMLGLPPTQVPLESSEDSVIVCVHSTEKEGNMGENINETATSLERSGVRPGEVGRKPRGWQKPLLVALPRQDRGGEPVAVRQWRLIHRRLGHVSYKAMEQLNDAVQGADLPPRPKDLPVCLVCERANNKRRFKSAGGEPYFNRGLVHIDTMGPIGVDGRGGERYMLGIVDDTSRLATTFCMRTKDEATGLIAEYCSERAAQGKPVTHIRTDNARELTTDVLIAKLRNLGCRVEPVPTYSPHLNGVAERFNGTIATITRALLSDSELPLYFWSDALRHATRLYNRRPHTKHGSTPFFSFYGKQPSIAHLLTFGCIVQAQLPQEHRLVDKISDRNFSGVYLGGESFGGYEVWDPTHRKSYRLGYVRPFDEGGRHGGLLFPGEKKSPNILFIPDLNVTLDNEMNSIPDTDNARSSVVDIASLPLPSPFPSASSSSSILPIPPLPIVSVSRSTIGQGTPDDPDEPADIFTAFASPSAQDWLAAVVDELEGHAANGTWREEAVSLSQKLLGCRWVFVTKRAPDRSIICRKARLVAQGFLQRLGRDYHLTESPVADRTSIRIFLAVAAARGSIVHQLDVTKAYLHGEIDLPNLFMRAPPGVKLAEGYALHLQRGLYGLKQAGRIWYETMKNHLFSQGWRELAADPVFFVRGQCSLVGYVDDFLVAGPTVALVKEAIATLSSRFPIKDMGLVGYMLGVDVKQLEDGACSISQETYINKLVARHGGGFSNKSTPLPVSTFQQAALDTVAGDKDAYMAAVGELLFISTWSRPDVAFAAGYLGRFASKPTAAQLGLTSHLLHYLATTAHYQLRYPFAAGSVILSASCDSDWAGDKASAKSTTGFNICINGTPVMWRSAKQSCVAASVAEAELMSLKEVVLQLRWIRILLQGIGEEQVEPTPVFCDSKTALDMIANHGLSRTTRHTCITQGVIREAVQEGVVALRKISTDDNTADLFTKMCNGDRTKTLSSLLNLF